jgi:hypothetical protein
MRRIGHVHATCLCCITSDATDDEGQGEEGEQAAAVSSTAGGAAASRYLHFGSVGHRAARCKSFPGVCRGQCAWQLA